MRTLLTEAEIRQGVIQLAQRIEAAYDQRPLTIVGVMTGAILLLGDLIRQLTMPVRVGVVQARSYRGHTNPGPLQVNADLLPEIGGHDVLLVDDILDTGHTLAELIRLIERMGPKSLRTVVLLRKQGRQQLPLTPDFVGFEIPDEFVVGYGLDYRDQYRNLPMIAALEPADLEP